MATRDQILERVRQAQPQLQPRLKQMRIRIRAGARVG